MTNVVYPKWKQRRLTNDAASALDGAGVTGVLVALIDTAAYAYNAAHEFYSDLGASVVATQELLNKTFLNGVFDADDPVFPPAAGPSVEALVIFVRNAGASNTWRLVAYIDQGVTNLPFTPNGTLPTAIAWNVQGIFAL